VLAVATRSEEGAFSLSRVDTASFSLAVQPVMNDPGRSPHTSKRNAIFKECANMMLSGNITEEEDLVTLQMGKA